MAFQELVVPKRPRGRPVLPYSLPLVREIAFLVGDGMKLHAACASDDRFPCPALFYEWLHDHPEALRVWQAGKAAKCEALTDECIQIADDSTVDWVEHTDREAHKGANGEVSEVVTVTIRERPEILPRVKERLAQRHRAQARYLPHQYGNHAPLPAPPDPLTTTAPIVAATPGDDTIELVKHETPAGEYWAAVVAQRKADEKEK